MTNEKDFIQKFANALEIHKDFAKATKSYLDNPTEITLSKLKDANKEVQEISDL